MFLHLNQLQSSLHHNCANDRERDKEAKTLNHSSLLGREGGFNSII